MATSSIKSNCTYIVTVMISDETPIQLFADYPTTEYK